MKNLAISALLLVVIGLSACSKDQKENTGAVENTSTEQAEGVVDPIVTDEEAQPLDAAPLETDETATSEPAAQ